MTYFSLPLYGTRIVLNSDRLLPGSLLYCLQSNYHLFVIILLTTLICSRCNKAPVTRRQQGILIST